jgi:thiamine-phosphate pyrophosphorylase
MPAKGDRVRERIGRLHVITERLDLARAALDAGAPVIQLRAKDLGDAAAYELACRMCEACDEHGATFIVNDRVDVAVAAGAHGAHVGEHDLPVDAARRVLGDDAILGGTARDPVTAWAHEVAGASYLGVGPTYVTASKEGLPDPLGVARVGEVARAVSIPVIAIAGITADRVAELIDAGVHGVAVIGAIERADDPFAATAELLRALEKAGGS